MSQRNRVPLLALTFVFIMVYGFFDRDRIDGEIEITPMLSPFTFIVSSQGVGLAPDWTLVTPIATFAFQPSVGSEQPVDGFFLLITRDDDAPAEERYKKYIFDLRLEDVRVDLLEEEHFNRYRITKDNELELLMGERAIARHSQNRLEIDVTGKREFEVEIYGAERERSEFWEDSVYVPLDMYRRALISDAGLHRMAAALVADAFLWPQYTLVQFLLNHEMDRGVVAFCKVGYLLLVIRLAYSLNRKSWRLEHHALLAFTLGMVILGLAGALEWFF